ncbi:asparagine synthase-related protein [Sphingomonas sp. ASV193]|uniref:asparagine synthase-related protein n=1 Tax=Sphingomonas sp. ASV193 TaxID=3144405 RepID=UPI0032E916E9
MRGLARYGTSLASQSIDRLTLSRNLYPTVPEDRFDRGPVDNGPLLLVGDVRIDNRDELCRALDISPATQSTMSDSTLAAQLVRDRGVGGLNLIAGEYALAWWDRRDATLTLARGPISFRPLFFVRKPDFLAFASMPSGLLGLPGVTQRPDLEWLSHYHAQLPTRGRATQFAEIERVEPGHAVTVGDGTIDDRAFYDWQVDIDPRLRGPVASEALRDAVEVAVRAQLRGAAGKVANHLSAGLDSAIVTTTTARMIGDGQVTAFTAGPRVGAVLNEPPGWFGDETALAARVAAGEPNIDHVIVRPDRQSPLTTMAADFHFQQQPTINPCNAVWGRAIAGEAKRRGHNVLLTGAGGNFTLTFGAVEQLPEWLARGNLVSAWRGIGALRGEGRSLASALAAATFPLLPPSAWRLASRLFRTRRDLSRYAAVPGSATGRIEHRAAELGFDTSYAPRRDPIGTRIDGLTRSDGGNYYKGMLAEFGISIRDPLLDLRLVRLCLSIPPGEFLVGPRPRDLARRAFSDRLPAATLAERRRGNQAADWAEGMVAALPDIRAELDVARRTPGLGEVIDLDQLDADAAALATVDPLDAGAEFRFRLRLLRGVAATAFARRVAGTN